MLHIWFNQTQSHSMISNRLLPPSIPLLLRATSHDRLFSCLWLLIIEIFLARFRLHLKNVFKAKAFSINLPTASQPQKKNRHRILFIYIEQSEQVPSLAPSPHLSPPSPVKSKCQTKRREKGMLALAGRWSLRMGGWETRTKILGTVCRRANKSSDREVWRDGAGKNKRSGAETPHFM